MLGWVAVIVLALTYGCASMTPTAEQTAEWQKMAQDGVMRVLHLCDEHGGMDVIQFNKTDLDVRCRDEKMFRVQYLP